MRRAFVILVSIGFLLNAALLIIFAQAVDSSSNEVQQIRSDFCVFSTQVVAGAHRLPQVQGRIDAEQAYGHLKTKLHCLP